MRFALGQSFILAADLRVVWPLPHVPGHLWIIKIIIPKGFPQPAWAALRVFGQFNSQLVQWFSGLRE